MSAIATIEKVLATNLLTRELTIIPSRGASVDEINEESGFLCRALGSEHAALLRRWNGIGLEVIRLFGCGDSAGETGQLSKRQMDCGLAGAIVLGSDAAGFLYVESGEGGIYSIDTDGNELKLIAGDLDDLFDRVIFGADGDSFGGDEWLVELKRVRMIG